MQSRWEHKLFERLMLLPCSALLCLAAGCASGGNGTGADKGGSELHFTAFAVNLGVIPAPVPDTGPRTGVVDVILKRDSTDEEREKLVAALQEGGQNGLLKAIQKMPSVGRIRAPGQIGLDIRYAQTRPTRDGRRDVFLLSDRPVRFFEEVNQTRSADFPFVVVDLKVDQNGKGDGQLLPAASIEASQDMKFIDIDNFTTEPIRLQNVRQMH